MSDGVNDAAKNSRPSSRHGTETDRTIRESNLVVAAFTG
jgi:hypothetical protein